MGIDNSEQGLEGNIESSLIRQGYIERTLKDKSLKDFKEHALDVELLFKFLEDTQEKAVNRLKKIHGERYEKNVLARINQELNRSGVIDCLRHGIKDRVVTLRLVYNKQLIIYDKTIQQIY